MIFLMLLMSQVIIETRVNKKRRRNRSTCCLQVLPWESEFKVAGLWVRILNYAASIAVRHFKNTKHGAIIDFDLYKIRLVCILQGVRHYALDMIICSYDLR